MNPDKFTSTSYGEKWGSKDDTNGYVYFYPTALKELCDKGGYSMKLFVSWAVKNHVIETDKEGKTSKVKRLNPKDKPVRMYWIRTPKNEQDKKDESPSGAKDEEGFVDMTDQEYQQLGLAFLDD